MSYYDKRLPADWTPEGLVTWVTDWLADRDVVEVAAGTGHWTRLLAPHVRSVVATEGHARVVALARAHPQPRNVTVLQADAYALDGVGGGLGGAFMGDWWSHVPRERLASFLDQVHSRLEPGAHVAIVDHLPWPSKHPLRTDARGDTFQTRHLRDGRQFEILKNFPTEDEVRSTLESRAHSIQLQVFPDCGVKRSGRWAVRYVVDDEQADRSARQRFSHST